MTTPNRQSPQVKNNVQTEGAKVPWYRSPIVWLGIVITVVVFIGCLQFLMLAADIRSQESAYNSTSNNNTQTKTSKKKELTHILGVPISASSLEKHEKNSKNEDGENTDDSL